MDDPTGSGGTVEQAAGAKARDSSRNQASRSAPPIEEESRRNFDDRTLRPRLLGRFEQIEFRDQGGEARTLPRRRPEAGKAMRRKHALMRDKVARIDESPTVSDRPFQRFEEAHLGLGEGQVHRGPGDMRDAVKSNLMLDAGSGRGGDEIVAMPSVAPGRLDVAQRR